VRFPLLADRQTSATVRLRPKADMPQHKTKIPLGSVRGLQRIRLTLIELGDIGVGQMRNAMF